MLNNSALSFVIKYIKQKHLQVTQGFLLFYGKLSLSFPFPQTRIPTGQEWLIRDLDTLVGIQIPLASNSQLELPHLPISVLTA